MKIYVHIVLCCIITILSIQGSAQDIHFSQFYKSPHLRTPALVIPLPADIRNNTIYRSQLTGVFVSNQTPFLIVGIKMVVENSETILAIEGQILKDKDGTIIYISNHLVPAFNLHKSLIIERNGNLSMGNNSGRVQSRFYNSKITPNDQYGGIGYNKGLSTAELDFNTQLGQNQENNLFNWIDV